MLMVLEVFGVFCMLKRFKFFFLVLRMFVIDFLNFGIMVVIKFLCEILLSFIVMLL